MQRPPRHPSERLFTKRMVFRSALQGLGALAATLAVFVAAMTLGLTEPDARTLTFSTLIVTNLALIFANRSLTRSLLGNWRFPNPALRWIAAGALVLLAAILYVPALRDLFRMAPPHPMDALAIVAAGLAALIWMEAVKMAASRA